MYLLWARQLYTAVIVACSWSVGISCSIFTLRSSSCVPIYEYPPDKYSAYQMMQILLDPNIDTKRIAKQRPLETTTSATFIVDVRNLKH